MTISTIQSHNNNNFISAKKVTAATLTGAAILAGEEVYNTRQNLLQQKDSYKSILSGFNVNAKKTDEYIKN